MKVILLTTSLVFFGVFTPAAAELAITAPFGNFTIRETSFPNRDFPITAYGAKAGGDKCTAAFAKAMAACNAAGGGRVVVPAGKWLTGAVHFKSNCNLHLAEGAVLEFTDDPADYPEVHTTWEGIECYNYSPLLYAYEVENVAITGSGTIAPRMDLWRKWFKRPPEHMKATEHLYHWCSTNAPMASRRLLALDSAHMRPHLIQMNRARRVLLEDFKIRESPFWMIHLYHSDDCVVRRLDTYAHGHNNDGVDVDMTKNVLIEKCRFDQGDDGVVLKAGRNADAWRLGRCTENVVVRDCDMVESHSLLGIGSELSGGVRNVWMTRCSVADTYSMLRIKTGRRRGGFVENVWIDHCRGKKLIRVFNIFTDYCAQWGKFPDYELRRTRIHNINVSDMVAEVAKNAIELHGDKLLPASKIRVRNVKVAKAVESFADVRNCIDVKIDGLELGGSGDDFAKEQVVLENGGARVAISREGGRILSWQVAGRDVFFMPAQPKAYAGDWSHGGLSLCWPWFGKKNGVASSIHGFARNRFFAVRRQSADSVTLGLALQAGEVKEFPHAVDLEWTISLSAFNRLSCVLRTTNQGEKPFEFSNGIQPYFAVSDYARITLQGVKDSPFAAEHGMDAAFPRLADEVAMKDAGAERELRLTLRGNSGVVVWSPGDKEPPNRNLVPGEPAKFIGLGPSNRTKEGKLTLTPGATHELVMDVTVSDSRP